MSKRRQPFASSRSHGHAIRNPATRSTPVPEAKPLTSRCWCGRSEVVVTPEDVRRGQTRACGTDRCKRMRDALSG